MGDWVQVRRTPLDLIARIRTTELRESVSLGGDPTVECRVTDRHGSAGVAQSYGPVWFARSQARTRVGEQRRMERTRRRLERSLQRIRQRADR